MGLSRLWWLFCMATIGGTLAADFDSQLSPMQGIEHIVAENQRCIRCHRVVRKKSQTEAIKTVGAHDSERYANNCTACHGDKGPHPLVDDVMLSHTPHPRYTALEQNILCINCHRAVDLRQYDWTHDVHVKELNCSACHQLHQPDDPIASLTPRQRIELCVDCHKGAKQ